MSFNRGYDDGYHSEPKFVHRQHMDLIEADYEAGWLIAKPICSAPPSNSVINGSARVSR